MKGKKKSCLYYYFILYLAVVHSLLPTGEFSTWSILVFSDHILNML